MSFIGGYSLGGYPMGGVMLGGAQTEEEKAEKADNARKRRAALSAIKAKILLDAPLVIAYAKQFGLTAAKARDALAKEEYKKTHKRVISAAAAKAFAAAREKRKESALYLNQRLRGLPNPKHADQKKPPHDIMQKVADLLAANGYGF